MVSRSHSTINSKLETRNPKPETQNSSSILEIESSHLHVEPFSRDAKLLSRFHNAAVGSPKGIPNHPSLQFLDRLQKRRIASDRNRRGFRLLRWALCLCLPLNRLNLTARPHDLR